MSATKTPNVLPRLINAGSVRRGGAYQFQCGELVTVTVHLSHPPVQPTLQDPHDRGNERMDGQGASRTTVTKIQSFCACQAVEPCVREARNTKT